MTTELPQFFYRTRENGALVYRVDTENRQRRIEMEQIAVVNTNKGEIKPHGDRELEPGELEEIRGWMEARQALLARREMDDIHRTIDHLNQTAQWAQARAEDDQLEEVTDALLLAMHDLRSVLVRKKADRVTKG
ncbi:hypothetical protein [Antarctobacter jejuensis]|uniref:hypothetical protein n=1 Tax=Antarctobacter jejuensis TaxID=1439938 RepID=UPI003FD1BEEA